LRGSVEPTAELCPEARRVFDRVVSFLERRGTLSALEPTLVTELARIEVLLNREYRKPEPNVHDLSMLSQLHRSRLRDCGLPLQPSRSKYSVQPASPADRWAHLLKD
jgi:hypothetical protein